MSGEGAAADRVAPSVAQPSCDLSTICWNCGAEMHPEHAHYRCVECGWRDSCCDGPY